MEKHLYKKIRILSFQNAYNFGAVLQAYGLQQSIRSLGYKDVKFIRYYPRYLSDRYNPFLREFLLPDHSILTTFLKYINYPFFFYSRIRRNYKIQGSIDSLLLQTSFLVTSENELKNEEADVLICGSDQIWNTSLTGKFDPIYFGHGEYQRLGYAASYAASTELSSLNEIETEDISSLLAGLKYISVREIPIKDFFQKFTRNNIEVCVDPTILCGAQSFIDVASPRLVKGDYIVVYAYYPDDSLVVDMIKSIPNYEAYSVHVVMLGEKGVNSFFRGNYHSAITVQDFLSYFLYAKFVVTNSFHGLAFSLLFQKNFNVAFCEGKHVRCQSLLSQLGLNDRLVFSGNMSNWSELDYKVINERIDKVRNESLSYLKKVLEDET